MRIVVGLVLAWTLSLTMVASAQTTLPPDLVQLNNGGMVRGTILENLPGDHVTIQLPTGEMRTFAGSEVASAGPAAPPSYAAPQAPIVTGYGAPRRVHVHVEADQDGLTLQEVTGSATAVVGNGRGFSTITVDAFAPVCTAPCDVDMEARTYRLGVSEGEGQARRADHSLFTVDHDMSFRLEYASRDAIRIAGWFVLIGGMVIGAGIALAAWASTDLIHLPEENITICITGAVIFVASAIAGLAMTSLNDHADVSAMDGAVHF